MSIKQGSRIRLKKGTAETALLGDHAGTVEEVSGDEARITLDATETTSWLGREFWAPLDVLRPER